MGKARKSKRQLIRDEKRAKKRSREVANEEDAPETKRQRQDDGASNVAGLDDAQPSEYVAFLDGQDTSHHSRGPLTNGFEREFFGMLADQEQEYFRHADELLELNDFPTTEDRDMFLQNVYKEAEGKELKLASSQSCSRLMERLILLSNTRQKKHLYDTFAGHFISLITHRFAGHCCEKLFLQSAPVVTQELQGLVEPEPTPEPETKADGEQGTAPMPQSSMEDLLLLTLDELEDHLSYLLSDRYGSHALRALLLILSGRPLDQIATKSMLQSKKKEHVTFEGASVMASELSSQTRAVPSSFTIAIQKIIGDSTANIDDTALRVLATHPTGNPTLQLLLELELTVFVKKAKKAPSKAKAEAGTEEPPKEEPKKGESTAGLLEKLIPNAPESFSDEKSQASEFINSMLYDPIGSRLLETLITHCSGKIFKGLQAKFFGPRIATLLRNDIASYPAIRVLNRLSKEDLAEAVEKSLPQMPVFVEKGRFNVIKTLFERCNVRQASEEIKSLLQALTAANGGDWKYLVPKLCQFDDADNSKEAPKKDKFQPDAVKNKGAMLSHSRQLITALFDIPGPPTKAIQASLLALKPDQLLRLATLSASTSAMLVKALATSSQNPNFHKVLVAGLLPHTYELATSMHGQNVLNAVIEAPSKGGDGITVPFHLKENIMGQLESHERDLRESWLGRNVWRAWRGDLWSRRRPDWVRWAKETDPEADRLSTGPKPKQAAGAGGDGG
ncbi:armadillo-type protein [Lasiosphaeria miniovina]|uniref:Nucleolar protein 9 n=1 Tax=Lasiosphaeria miniovina TaxID=1954250 RepID=A0AA40ABV7_9PEZI|nr:armadillo-type protein [Lasiosphaeria miniovina]KAK0713039.1 armadillo-type protein [Lasiosphaeria miniovina]